jgi:alkylation response protein AidB-like acyl-CoA dehydrogenase
VLARAPEGPTFFVVSKEAEGFTRGKGEEKHGIRASNTSPLTFDDVYVPADQLIGGVPGQGLKQANLVFGYTRLMVAAMALGAGEAALAIVKPYALERIQFGSPLAEKQGYTHKLIVPHFVALEAAATYIDEIALILDQSKMHEDFQVEGSIAKLFASEAANRAADDAMQALGGYGYINEFEVEKIKRDVKITCIYEGTSEIQQNIISMFRWKKTRKTKGAFYGDMAKELEGLGELHPISAGKIYGACADILNKTIQVVNDAKLTRQQYVMFALADMMTQVEIGASVGRKAARLAQADAPGASQASLVALVFADMTAQMVENKVATIIKGSGALDDERISAFYSDANLARLADSSKGLIPAMDALTDIFFERSV